MKKSQVRDDQQLVRSINSTTIGQSSLPALSPGAGRGMKSSTERMHIQIPHLKMRAASVQRNIFYYALGIESSDRSEAGSYCSSENLSFHASHVLIGIILSSPSVMPKKSEIPFC